MMAPLWCLLVDGSDQLEERRIALEVILFRTGSSNEKPRYCLYNFLPKIWTTWSKYLLATPTFHILFEVESAETIPPELSLFILVNTEGSSHPMSFYSTLSRAPHSALIDRGEWNGLSHGAGLGQGGANGMEGLNGGGKASPLPGKILRRNPAIMFLKMFAVAQRHQQIKGRVLAHVIEHLGAEVFDIGNDQRRALSRRAQNLLGHLEELSGGLGDRMGAAGVSQTNRLAAFGVQKEPRLLRKASHEPRPSR